MSRTGSASRETILIVGPRIPPYGGMALQARLMEDLMNREGIAATLVPSNPPLPPGLEFCEYIRGLRPLLRCGVFCLQLWRMLPSAGVVHILACSWLYFFVVVYPAVLISRWRGKRVVLNYRGGEAGRFFRYFGWASWPTFRLADTVTAPSRFLADLIEHRFHTPVRIVPNILDFSLFRYRQRIELRPKLLITRHLEKIYAIDSVIRAFRVVKECYPEASLWIVGTGKEGKRLRSLVSDWDLKDVRFLGHIPHDDLPEIYDQCDIFVNASLVDNFPGALLEASAAGLIVVTTGAGGIPYIYEHMKTALLVEPGDWEGLARSVMNVLQDDRLAFNLSTAAAAMAQACEWTHVREQLYGVYGLVIQKEREPEACLRQAGEVSK
jgi:L-malate glycosyltransferase